MLRSDSEESRYHPHRGSSLKTHKRTFSTTALIGVGWFLTFEVKILGTDNKHCNMNCKTL
jgi:hypothetical protein